MHKPARSAGQNARTRHRRRYLFGTCASAHQAACHQAARWTPPTPRTRQQHTVRLSSTSPMRVVAIEGERTRDTSAAGRTCMAVMAAHALAYALHHHGDTVTQRHSDTASRKDALRWEPAAATGITHSL
jgi:hypothetical protein